MPTRSSSKDPNRALSKRSFWDDRYKRLSETANNSTSDSHNAHSHQTSSENDDHEWFRNFNSLRPFLEAHLPAPSPPPGPKILHLGTGTSTLPVHLYTELSYHSQTALDFSPVCISLMSSHYPPAVYRGLAFKLADVRSMPEIESGSFDVAIDKGTLDAMLYGSLWDPEGEVKDNVGKYVNEVWRVLKKGGKWLYITYRQPHFMRNLLKRPVFREEEKGGWEEAEVETMGGEEGSFEYFGWVLRK